MKHLQNLPFVDTAHDGRIYLLGRSNGWATVIVADIETTAGALNLEGCLKTAFVENPLSNYIVTQSLEGSGTSLTIVLDVYMGKAERNHAQILESIRHSFEAGFKTNEGVFFKG